MSSVAAIAMNQTIQETNDINVYVLGDKEVAKSFTKFLGQNVGNSQLMSVSNGDELPVEKPSVLIFTDASRTQEVVNYCRENNVLSISNNPELCEKGVTLGVGRIVTPMFEKKHSLASVQMYLNETASDAEGQVWDSSIHAVTKPVSDTDDFVVVSK